jgi:tRNA (guanine10-N2)-dimethyltransferase
MNYLFELSKEHKRLPTDEILSCLSAENINYKILVSNEDILLIESNSDIETINHLTNRLSFTFYIDEFLFSSDNSIEDIKEAASKNPLYKTGSIAIKYKNRSNNINSQPIVKALAKIYTKNRKVILENPDIEIRSLITDSKLYVGSKISEIDRSQFEDRKVQHRPFFSPISLHPKVARALVNLTSIKRNQILLDPFCGTGGILLEAGFMGIKVIGSDVEEKMIEGCKKTLDFYKIKNNKLFCSDIGEIQNYIDKVDSIATDLPYGKSTTTKGEKMEKLYERAFESMSNLLKKDGKAVIGLSNKDLIPLGQKYFYLEKKYDFKIHRSLTRYFVVYKK